MKISQNRIELFAKAFISAGLGITYAILAHELEGKIIAYVAALIFMFSSGVFVGIGVMED